ncbi:pyruvate dehydrogenase (acetyl-transferring), homodimeric type [Candidatus Riesia pediculicola]|uniref:Pyruvate dehydrogenase E1 component n=1 Tax=Riesia pediculicola (strain USDA) TaxID=515618 RepID=D4G7S4_RIEPU|nr:pyruvate dehydrogenase (acetyl-transferring), homodimeric type [Candidatus Riesia pediculicola]ADD79811.1 pyruvate dehydrogenase E1 component [Candidatus Riesia pediculicola USDA]ARC53644.1 pyruvate dehydrogenase [Candidatus Riesia pediculicola]QOJ86294.1 pyruvate dehydrogenase (acetyl-transferring), homodimeric type [Candidatus Riesia pediculicola]
MRNESNQNTNSIEIIEWIQSIAWVLHREGIDRCQYIIKKLLNYIQLNQTDILPKLIESDYINTIPFDKEPSYPGELDLEEKICSVVRWNAIMMVLRASKKNLNLGGHIASFQSCATIYEVCFNHFFQARNSNLKQEGDLIYFQGHVSPGIYSRAFLEGRITKKQINNFRQEITENLGLPSYPHPRLLPEFWQFPTVSMGLGAINSIYQAKFLKYLHKRGLKDTSNQTVYAFLGDGEMDEPESKGAITIASRENLDNLIFVINCNLQRLDGPVLGNGKIINELNRLFIGAGWNVIKVIWGSQWDDLFRKDVSEKLLHLVNKTTDGDYQNLRSKDGKYIREKFFNQYLETKELVQNMTDEQIQSCSLNLGGHDPKKIYAAFQLAKRSRGKPNVILIQTIKGYGMGEAAEGKNIAHQVKNISTKDIKYFRDRFKIPISDREILNLPIISFKKDSEENQYIHSCRKKLGGYVPKRIVRFTKKINIPNLKIFHKLLEKQKDMSTTMAFIRAFNIMLKCNSIKNRLVLIIADEGRTFGMEGLFRQIGIYNSFGQKYIPQDKDSLIYYREDEKGMILQEGINELGACASWISASTSYSNNDFPMIPFYIYYSIFGFQRVGDLLWAAGDQQARGFLIGGTSGRTTLNGEGLQHEDGHSHIQSLTIPNCISYNPAYTYEVAVILQDGLRRMYGDQQENIYYYLTVLNENYEMPPMPIGAEEGIRKGIYKIENLEGKNGEVQLLGSGSILCHVRKAALILSIEYGIASTIYSVTSFTELCRNGQDCDRWNMLHPLEEKKVPYVTKIMNHHPAIAATDYMKIFADQIRPYVPTQSYKVLGTDGFGRSDSRKNLRNYFEISSNYIVVASLNELSNQKKIDKTTVYEAIKKYKIDPEKINPRLV